MIIPDPIVAGAHGNRAKAAPVMGAQTHERPHIATRRSTQVITQIELPPYRGPRSLPDLVPSEIIFGHLFEAFRRMLQAKADAAAAPAEAITLPRTGLAGYPLRGEFRQPSTPLVLFILIQSLLLLKCVLWQGTVS
jgi:hypothetical protein